MRSITCRLLTFSYKHATNISFSFYNIIVWLHYTLKPRKIALCPMIAIKLRYRLSQIEYSTGRCKKYTHSSKVRPRWYNQYPPSKRGESRRHHKRKTNSFKLLSFIHECLKFFRTITQLYT